ncbi:MAG: phosphoribosylamine--glycine ligase [Gemmatimonadetes bacterium]|nr:phosphoribosylamine--glycine ligase [Gemmatimonadota bacterium]
MRILIVGNGGREHALLWKLRADAPDASFYATRPNGGMQPAVTPVDLSPEDVGGLAAWASTEDIDLTIVGPEAPLASGIADVFAARGLRIFGPTRTAARIEASKAYAKQLMGRAGVPTARFATFTSFAAAKRHIHDVGAPLVVKASGLAAGKGAIVCPTEDEAITAAEDMLVRAGFGEAGREVVIEEFMSGEELSVLALVDGESALPLLPSQDHKRLDEGDTGPNTGGMGAYAPVSIATEDLLERVRRSILEPTLAALKEDGAEFRGLLYAGLMMQDGLPRVVEFNCRFGDPETQAIIPLLSSSLLEPVAEIAAGGSTAGIRMRWRRESAVTTVLASHGYPGSYAKGVPIVIPEDVATRHDVHVFHAGTRLEKGGLVTSGGRVLAVTGTASSLAEAAAVSRTAANAITFEGKTYRKDIGWRELARQTRTAAKRRSAKGRG